MCCYASVRQLLERSFPMLSTLDGRPFYTHPERQSILLRVLEITQTTFREQIHSKSYLGI